MGLIAVILVLLNGQAISFQETQPVKERGVVLVPARGVFQAMGARVHYNPVTREITAKKGETTIEMGVGRANAWVNGEPVQLPRPVRVHNGAILIPTRFVSEAFGARVVWDPARNYVVISTDSASAAHPDIPVHVAPIEVTFRADKREYRTGEPVMFTLVARNRSSQDQVLDFRSGQSFDISVTPTKNDESFWRWDWSFGRFFTQAIRTKTLKPDGTISLTATWDQIDNSGKPMPRGEYSVAAKVVANDEIEAPNMTITLN